MLQSGLFLYNQQFAAGSTIDAGADFFIGGDIMVPNYKLQASMQKRMFIKYSEIEREKIRGILRCNKYLIPGSDGRVGICTCGRNRTPKYVGLQTCKNMWCCPVCAPRYLNICAAKMTLLLKKAAQNGFVAYMVTITIPHNGKQTAAEVLANLDEACKKYGAWERDAISRYNKLPRFAGKIISTECKWSALCGYHFHRHVLYFMKKTDEPMFLRTQHLMYEKWEKLIDAYRNDGRVYTTGASMHFSQGAITDGGYIAKAVSSEMCKTGNKKSLSMDVLELLTKTGDNCLAVFKEVAEATKGKRRIYYSVNLTKNIGVDMDEITDQAMEEAARGEFTAARTVCTFTSTAWNEILEREYEDLKDHRARLLFAAQLDGIDGVRWYCFNNVLPLPKTDREYEFRVHGQAIG